MCVRVSVCVAPPPSQMGTQMVSEASATLRRGATAQRVKGNERSTKFTKQYNKGIQGLRR